MTYDVIVIGGGSAGLMASIAASADGAKVLLIDKGDKLGRKLGISGGGRCNVTNNKDLDELIKHIPGNGRFLHSAMSSFNNKDIIQFFEGLGISLKEEDNGRMFPVSDKAKTVVEALVNQVRKQGVEILVNSPVDRVLYQNGSVKGVKLQSGRTLHSRNAIIATGGKSVPYTGSEGDGYPWAVDAGHTITELFPTEVPLTSKEPFINSRELQGLSLRDVTLTVWSAKGKKLVAHRGDMLFTHFGLSGPAALRCSSFVVKALKQAREKASNHADMENGHHTITVTLTIDLFPDRSEGELHVEMTELARSEAKKAVKNVLKPLLAERLIPLALRTVDIQEDTVFANLPKQPWLDLTRLLKAFPVHVNGTLSIEEAFVTGGGVNLKEVDPRTMQSKLMKGLYFCGEVLDIHGYTGGYNITAAFVTGHTAGTAAASAEDAM
jgi:predicted Rossmann fold flavoprotein